MQDEKEEPYLFPPEHESNKDDPQMDSYDVEE